MRNKGKPISLPILAVCVLLASTLGVTAAHADGVPVAAVGDAARTFVPALLMVPGVPESTHETPLPVPETAVGIGPGTRLHIRFPGEGGTAACTANFVWQDARGELFLGSAGHCFLPSRKAATHGPGADFNLYRDVDVKACILHCDHGGLSGFLFRGDYVGLGEVAYARQERPDRGGIVDGIVFNHDDQGWDFGLVHIPASLHHLVRPEMPAWGATTGVGTVSPGIPVVHYGTGVGVGETWPTMGRGGVGESSDARHWHAATEAAWGDSGSALNVIVPVVNANGDVVGTETRAAGILTHLSYAPPGIAGTTIAQAQTLAREAGLEVEVVHALDG